MLQGKFLKETLFIAVFQTLFNDTKLCIPEAFSQEGPDEHTQNWQWLMWSGECTCRSTSCDLQSFFLGQGQTEPTCGSWFACLVSLKILSSLESWQLTAFDAYTDDVEKSLEQSRCPCRRSLKGFLLWKRSQFSHLWEVTLIERGPRQLTRVCGCSATARHFEGFRLFTSHALDASGVAPP